MSIIQLQGMSPFKSMQKIWILRKLLHGIGIDEIGAMEFLLDKMKTTQCNDEFFSSMKR